MSSFPPKTGTHQPLRIAQDGFVPDVVLDAAIRAGQCFRAGALLTLADGRRFVLQDAVRILGRRNGETDPYGLTGRVETLRQLVKQGAILALDGIRLGPAIYDVEHGVVAYPLATADESGMSPRMS